jgi:hypothetical protein
MGVSPTFLLRRMSRSDVICCKSRVVNNCAQARVRTPELARTQRGDHSCSVIERIDESRAQVACTGGLHKLWSARRRVDVAAR